MSGRFARGPRRTALMAFGCLALVAFSLPAAAAAGAPSFVFPAVVDAGGEPVVRPGVSLVVGDYNGDGKSDVMVPATGRRGVSVLLGNGAGGFAAPKITVLPDAGSAVAAAAGQLNADGRLDLVAATVSDTGSGARVLLGRGDGTFALGQQIVSVVTAVSHVAVADVNGDGKRDIAYVGQDTANGSHIGVVLGRGDGTFGAPRRYPPAYQIRPNDFDLADVNGDAAPDMVYLAGCPVVRLNTGNGSFGPEICSSDPTGRLGGVAQVVADFNGDARRDIATVDASGGHVTVGLGNGAGRFTVFRQYAGIGSQVNAINAADFTGDGRLDLVAAADASFAGPNAVSVLLQGVGDGSFRQLARYQTGGEGLAPIRLNADTTVDLVATGLGAGRLDATRNDGAGRFHAPRVYAGKRGNALPSEVKLADVNGDGRRDVVTVVYGLLNVRLDTGGGVLGPVRTTAAGDPQVLALALGDLNRDGRADAVVGSNPAGMVRVLLSRGDGTFAAPVDYSNGGGASVSALALGDVTGDGFLDVVSGAAGLSTLPGRGDGTFGPPILSGAVGGGAPTALADITGDGRLDAVTVVDSGTADNARSTVIVDRGRGDGTFVAAQQVDVDTRLPAAAAGDVTGDGRPDVALVGLAGSHTGRTGLFVLPNVGGTLSGPVYYGGPGFGIALADLTGDGRLDAVTDGPSQLWTFTSVAGGTLTGSRQFPAGKDAIDVAAGDMTGDRRAEMVELDSTNPEQIVVYVNTTP